MRSNRPFPKLNLWLNPEDIGLVNDVAANKFLRVIQVGLIVEKVAQHLRFEDLKAVTLASRDCLRCFRSTRAFSDKAKFVVAENQEKGISHFEDDYEEEDDDYEDYYSVKAKYGVQCPWLFNHAGGSYQPRNYSAFPNRPIPWNTELKSDLQTTPRYSPGETVERFRTYKGEVENDVTSKSFHILNTSDYPWKHFSFQLGLHADAFVDLDLIANFLESAESISIGFLPKELITERDKYVGVDDDIDEDVGFAVDKILESIRGNENLRELKLDARLMTSKCLYFDLKQLEPVAGQIESFGIYVDKPFSEHYYFSLRNNYLMYGRFTKLANLPLTRIKKLSIGKIIFFNQGMALRNSVEKNCALNSILKIVETCKDTLEELELHRDFWRDERMKVIKLPKLKRLNFSLSCRSRLAMRTVPDDDERKELEGAEAFLKNNPPLESLSMEVGKLRMALMYTLQDLGKLEEMEDLHLCAKDFLHDGLDPYMSSWAFLQHLGKLKKFSITCRRGQYPSIISVKKLIRHLPPSTRSISIVKFYILWDDDEDDDEPEDVGSMIYTFVNLRELNLSFTNVTDKVLQVVIKYCPNLLILQLSHTSVTDFGISGVAKHQGKSLADLKGLIRLNLGFCNSISPTCLLNVIKFDHLRDFTYCRENPMSIFDRSAEKFPPEFLYQLLGQNPCMEKVEMDIVGADTDEFARSLKKRHPRVHLQGSKRFSEDADSDLDPGSDSDGFVSDSDLNSSEGSDLYEAYLDFYVRIIGERVSN